MRMVGQRQVLLKHRFFQNTRGDRISIRLFPEESKSILVARGRNKAKGNILKENLTLIFKLKMVIVAWED